MHKADAALTALAAAVTGLSTVGANVERTRGYPKSDTPAISVRLYDIDPTNEISNAFQDSAVGIETVYFVSGSETDLDADILQIDAEVWAAIMADRTLGGSAVTTDPETLTFVSSADSEIPTAEAVRRWRVHIRHSITDAEA